MFRRVSATGSPAAAARRMMSNMPDRAETDRMIEELKQLHGRVKSFDKGSWSYWQLAAPTAAVLALGIYSNHCEEADIQATYMPNLKKVPFMETFLKTFLKQEPKAKN